MPLLQLSIANAGVRCRTVLTNFSVMNAEFMRLALIKDFDVYDRDLLGLKLRDRIRLTLERSGFHVRFFRDRCPDVQPAESFLIILKPMLIVERELDIEGRKMLISDGSIIGYLLDKDFFEFAGKTDIESAIDAYLKRNILEYQRIWAVILKEENIKQAERVLLNSITKIEKKDFGFLCHDGIVARTINRRMSIRISRYLAKRNVTPNQISIFSFILSLIGSIFFLSF